MSSRGDLRHSIRLSAKLIGTDERGNRFVQTAFTRDVSTRGACLTHVPPLLTTYSVVELEYRGKKGRFRVMWVGGVTNDEVGLQSLEPHRCIWGTPLPGQPVRSTAKAS